MKAKFSMIFFIYNGITIDNKGVTEDLATQEKTAITSNLSPRITSESSPEGRISKASEFCAKFLEVKEQLLSRSYNADWDVLMKSVFDRSFLGEEHSKLINL